MKRTGNLLLLISQIVFLVSGYGIQVIIARFLSPQSYGSWGVLTSVLIWFELAIISGFPKGVTKFTAESSHDNQGAIYRKSFLTQGAIGIGLGLLFFLLSHPLAILFNDDQLLLMFRISALDIPIYGLYFENMAYLNGKHRYDRMLLAQATYSLSKLGLITVLIIQGYGLVGASWGNVLASLAAFLFSQLLVGMPSRSNAENFVLDDLIRFAVPNTIFVIVFALIQYINFFLLKILSKSSATIGYYWAALLLAKVPYFLIEGTSKKMFSELSAQFGKNDLNGISQSLRQNLHFTVLLVSLIVSVTVGSSSDLLGLLFPKEYLASSNLLALLIVAYGLIAMMYFFIQALLSIGLERLATKIAFVTVIVAFFVNWTLIRSQDAPGAALAAVISFGFGMVASYIPLRGHFAGARPVTPILKIVAAATLTLLAGLWIQVEGRIGMVMKLCAVTGVFGITLYVLKDRLFYQLVRTILGKISGNRTS